MRKLLVAGLLLAALIVACETKTPVGPATVTPTTVTTSTPTTSPTTSTSSSTTTIPVIASLVRSFKAFPPPAPNVPSEMTLFYQLIVAAPVSAPQTAGGVVANADVPGENKYRITGVYVMGNGTTGTVAGELGGAVNPVETGGTFTGSLTAKTLSGCTAQREFAGPLGNQNFQWTGGGPGTASCSPSPLGVFDSTTMLLSDPGAPLPTPPPTSSSSSTTTTSVACTYSLSPPSPLLVGAMGGTQSVTITTQDGCGWSAQSFDSWITMNPPFGGTGTATITFNVASTTIERTASLRIAGQPYTVSQSGTLPDLLPATIACSASTPQTVTVTVRNQGGTTAPGTTTRIDFIGSEDPSDPADLPTSSLSPVAPTNATNVTATIPGDCYSGSSIATCSFVVYADYSGASAPTGIVVESDEVNNITKGSCTR